MRHRLPVDVLHVYEVDVIGDEAVDRESLGDARALVDARLADLDAAGVDATAHVLQSVGDHAYIGRAIASYAEHNHARYVVIGRPTSGAFARVLDQGSSEQLLAAAPCEVVVVGTERVPVRLASAR
jgi:nucleotide-binding universal stress UspA family protein